MIYHFTWLFFLLFQFYHLPLSVAYDIPSELDINATKKTDITLSFLLEIDAMDKIMKIYKKKEREREENNTKSTLKLICRKQTDNDMVKNKQTKQQTNCTKQTTRN